MHLYMTCTLIDFLKNQVGSQIYEKNHYQKNLNVIVSSFWLEILRIFVKILKNFYFIWIEKVFGIPKSIFLLFTEEF
jgi:hypothetical protein